jgi:hypothetical protein
MLSSATRMASSVLSPISRGYREAGIRGAVGSARKPLMIGGGILGAGTFMGSRRQGGLDKTVGRPTGMYKY